MDTPLLHTTNRKWYMTTELYDRYEPSRSVRLFLCEVSPTLPVSDRSSGDLMKDDTVSFSVSYQYHWRCSYIHAAKWINWTDRCGCRCASSCLTSGGSACHRTDTGTDVSPCEWAGASTVSMIAWNSCHTADTWTYELHQYSFDFHFCFRSPSHTAILMTSCQVTEGSRCCWRCCETQSSSGATCWGSGTWTLHHNSPSVIAV